MIASAHFHFAGSRLLTVGLTIGTILLIAVLIGLLFGLVILGRLGTCSVGLFILHAAHLLCLIQSEYLLRKHFLYKLFSQKIATASQKHH